jgi:hypothetical protein
MSGFFYIKAQDRKVVLDTVVQSGFCNEVRNFRPFKLTKGTNIIRHDCSDTLFVLNNRWFDYVEDLHKKFKVTIRKDSLYQILNSTLEKQFDNCDLRFNQLTQEFKAFRDLSFATFTGVEKDLFLAQQKLTEAENAAQRVEEKIKEAQNNLRKAKKAMIWQNKWKPIMYAAGGTALGILIGKIK